LPDPTVTDIDPPRPPSDDPDPTYNSPLLPELLVPVLITTRPLTPETPLLDVNINMEPLVVLLPYPVSIEI